MINKRPRAIRRYCSEIEKIENYDLALADMENMWDCHHRLEIGKNGEVMSRNDLIEHGLYYHRPPEELIFLLRSEHSRLHTLGKTHSGETRRRIGEAKKSWWTKRKMVGK